MMDLHIEVRDTEQLTIDYIQQINRLKNQHWSHSKEEHMKWFEENINSDDEHLMLWGKSRLQAYLNLIHVEVKIEKCPYRMLGIGNVCVSKEKEHTGIGAILMAAANAVLRETGLCGLLLCHDNTLKFYENCGWKKMEVETSIVKEKLFIHHVMFYDPSHKLSNKAEIIEIDRSF